MKKLTQKLIDSIALPRQGQQIIRDSQLKGFALRLTPGSMAYIVEARINRKSKRITICRADLVPLEEAKRKAIPLLAQMTSGIDPQVEKQKQEASQITLRKSSSL